MGAQQTPDRGEAEVSSGTSTSPTARASPAPAGPP